MSAKDVYHEVVKHALRKDGWVITHDPFTLSFGQRDVYVDLGAEQPLAAEKDGQKIAVEIKSFRSASDIRDLEVALGQYVFYRALLVRAEPLRRLFLAVPAHVFVGLLDEAIARPALEDVGVALLVFDPQQEVILKWIP